MITSGIDQIARNRIAAAITPAASSARGWLTGVAGVDNIAATPPAGFAVLTDGMRFAFEAVGANTGAVTLDIGTGAKPIVLLGGAALVAGDIPGAGTLVEVFYTVTGDHYHAQLIRQPSAVAASKLSGAASAGTGTRYARADHQHGSAIVGVTDGSAAAAGDVGEYMEIVWGLQNFPATGVVGDAGFLTLAAGDWDLDLSVLAGIGTSAGFTQAIAMIGAVAGNNTTGLVYGSNFASFALAGAAFDTSVSIPSYRVSINAPTTYYAKVRAVYGAGNPPVNGGRLSARRVR